MNWKNDGGPAFPQFDIAVGERDGHGDPIEAYTVANGGMSLRDYTAIAAMAALIAKSPFIDRDGVNGRILPDIEQFRLDIAVSAYCYADAMLEAAK